MSSRANTGLVFDEVSVRYDDRTAVDTFSGRAAPGVLTVLSAPSGAGKSSLIAAALGFVPFDGAIDAGGAPDAPGRRAAIAWAGQRPGLVAGTVASNIALGSAVPDFALVSESLRAAAAEEISPDAVLGAAGVGLSGGQAQRVAVARALYRMRAQGCSVLILDEPTSALDHATEARLLATLRRLADEGKTVLIASHREAVVMASDAMLTSGALTHVR
jgi:ATP-binding cassette subfamily C protein CydD